MSRDDFILTGETMLVEDATTELVSAIFSEIGQRSIERREGQPPIHEALEELVHAKLTDLAERIAKQSGSEPDGQGEGE